MARYAQVLGVGFVWDEEIWYLVSNTLLSTDLAYFLSKDFGMKGPFWIWIYYQKQESHFQSKVKFNAEISIFKCLWD